MELYGLVLLAHSWLRWAVVVLGVAVLVVRWQTLRGGDRLAVGRLDRGFIAAVNVQFLLGVLLYLFLSPYPRAALADLGGAMGQSVLRYFAIEHAFGMLIAVAAAHLGHSRLKAASRPDATVRSGRVPFVSQVAWLVATLVSMPWPFLQYGRPLARFFP